MSSWIGAARTVPLAVLTSALKSIWRRMDAERRRVVSGQRHDRGAGIDDKLKVLAVDPAFNAKVSYRVGRHDDRIRVGRNRLRRRRCRARPAACAEPRGV